MYYPRVLITGAAILSSALALHIPRANLEARDDVGLCEEVLVALKASAFCSSFVPIKDVTSTVAYTGTVTTVTETASCTPKDKQKRGLTTTPSVGPTLSTTPATSPAATTSGCSIKGVPGAVNAFGCSVITSACRNYVHAKTITVTDDKPGSISTKTETVTPKCSTSTSKSTTSPSIIIPKVDYISDYKVVQ